MLWNKTQEKDFFINAKKMTTSEKLLYITEDKKYLAYWPKKWKGKKTTLQSRNSLIGNYTEKWCKEFFDKFASENKNYIVQGVICEEIGLSKLSPADIALCKTNDIVQKPENILLIMEVKMSLVWNWELVPKGGKHFDLVCIGDYKTHQGNPGLLRSDTMLKAIGKSINIRVSSFSASKIPIIILGNTPITKSYYEKVDHLKRNGIIQGFWSLNPKPLDGDGENIKNTPYKGFYRFDSYEELKQSTNTLLKKEKEFFSSMQTKKQLGKIIEVANKEITYEAKAQRFLELLRKNEE